MHVAAEVGGRLVDLRVAEGDRVAPGDVIAHLDTRDIELQIGRARAERACADAQLRLLQAGARPEDIRQAQAQVDGAAAEAAAAESELRAAETDLQRFEALCRPMPDRRSSVMTPGPGSMSRASGNAEPGSRPRRAGGRVTASGRRAA